LTNMDKNINGCCKDSANLKEYKGENPSTEYLLFCKECGQVWVYVTPFEMFKAKLKDDEW